MSNSDIFLGQTSVPFGQTQVNKPMHLVVLSNQSDTKKTNQFFISLDKPDLLLNCVSCKGFFYEATEANIIKNFQAILTKQEKESIIEISFPWHRVQSIRSLVFRAK